MGLFALLATLLFAALAARATCFASKLAAATLLGLLGSYFFQNARTGCVHDVFCGVEQVADGIVDSHTFGFLRKAADAERAVLSASIETTRRIFRAFFRATPRGLGRKVEVALAHGVAVGVRPALVVATVRAHRHIS